MPCMEKLEKVYFKCVRNKDISVEFLKSEEDNALQKKDFYPFLSDFLRVMWTWPVGIVIYCLSG